jgi:hypothetical protein
MDLDAVHEAMFQHPMVAASNLNGVRSVRVALPYYCELTGVAPDAVADTLVKLNQRFREQHRVLYRYSVMDDLHYVMVSW